MRKTLTVQAVYSDAQGDLEIYNLGQLEFDTESDTFEGVQAAFVEGLRSIADDVENAE